MKAAEKRADRATGEGLVRVQHLADDGCTAPSWPWPARPSRSRRPPDVRGVRRPTGRAGRREGTGRRRHAAGAALDRRRGSDGRRRAARASSATSARTCRSHAVAHLAVERLRPRRLLRPLHAEGRRRRRARRRDGDGRALASSPSSSACTSCSPSRPCSPATRSRPTSSPRRREIAWARRSTQDPKMANKPPQVIDKIVEGKLGRLLQAGRPRRAGLDRRSEPQGTVADLAEAARRRARRPSAASRSAARPLPRCGRRTPVPAGPPEGLGRGLLAGAEPATIEATASRRSRTRSLRRTRLGVEIAVVNGGGNILRGGQTRIDGPRSRDGRLHGHAGDGHQRAGPAGRAREPRDPDARAHGHRDPTRGRALHPPALRPPPREGAAS